MKTLILTLVLFSAIANAGANDTASESQNALLNTFSGVYHLVDREGQLANIDNMIYPGHYKVQLRIENGCLVEEIQHAQQALVKYGDLTRITCNKNGPTKREFKWADDNQSALLSTSKHTDKSSFKIDVANQKIIINTGYTWSHSGLMALVIPSYISGYNYTERIFSIVNGQVRYVEQSGHGEGKVRRAEDPKTVAMPFLKIGESL